MDYSRLRIDRLIVHDVPRTGLGSGPVLSEIESPLDATLKNFVREKISDSLRFAANDVIFNDDANSPIPTLIFDHMDGRESDFVALSQELAHHLYISQPPRSSAGLLTIADGTVVGQRALVIVKLEKEEGLRMQQEVYQGKLTFNMEHISNMTLGKNTRVFKVGFFVQTGTSLDTIVGAVSDRQRSTQARTPAANYFLQRFLGCTYREAPAVVTERFYHASERYFNTHITDPVNKARYHIALQAVLADTHGEISVSAFAEDHLVDDDRQPYLNHLEQAGVPIGVLRRISRSSNGRCGNFN